MKTANESQKWMTNIRVRTACGFSTFWPKQSHVETATTETTDNRIDAGARISRYYLAEHRLSRTRANISAATSARSREIQRKTGESRDIRRKIERSRRKSPETAPKTLSSLCASGRTQGAYLLELVAVSDDNLLLGGAGRASCGGDGLGRGQCGHTARAPTNSTAQIDTIDRRCRGAGDVASCLPEHGS